MGYFDKKVIVITGSNGGLGSEMIRQLSKTKAKIIQTDTAAGALQDTGNTLAYIQADLSSREGCEKLAEACQACSSRIDMLVNNAGIASVGDFVDIPDESWEAHVNINLLAPMRLVKLFLPAMIKSHSGHIVNISSVGGFIALPRNATYAATKFGLRGFGTSISAELGAYNIHVTNIYPSFTQTPILDSDRFGYERSKELPGLLVDKPRSVVKKALHGVAQKQVHVFPSQKARVFSSFSRLFPDAMALASNQITRIAD